MRNGKQTILLGMSGGVDSSVVAALLKKQDFQVKGLFLRMHGEEEKLLQDIQDVTAICKKLDIPLQIKDVQKKFKKEVVGYFLAEYAAGRTPNPCIFCNENFKFKILLKEAEKAGIDYIATGHYARLSREISNLKLKIAKDKNKDQSYFLYRLGQKELGRIIFPLGEYTKTEVRALAKKFKLPVHAKRESQDVCFMARLTTEMFLKKNLKLKKGKIVNEAGEVIGEHDGVVLYTIGQRKGIHIGGTGPYYVIGKDLKKNQIIVSNNLEKLPLFSKVAILEKVSWTTGAPKMPLRVLARSRYRNPLVYATIKACSTKQAGCENYIIEFEKLEKSLASGQSVVFYSKNEEVIGGGIIK